MTSRQLKFGLIVLLMVLAGAIGGLAYIASGVLQTKADRLASLKTEALTASNQQAQLQKNKNDIARYADLNKIAEAIVPQDKDQAEAVLEIVNLARMSGIGKLTSITFPASSLGGLNGTTTSPSTLTQVTPVPGIPGVYDLKITVTQDNSSRVPYATFIRFLQNLERNRRTAQISNISVQPDSQNPGQVAFTLTIDEYIKP